MSTQPSGQPADRSKFYSAQYELLGKSLVAEVRREVYGVDFGQQGWRSLDEHESIAALIEERSPCRTLDIACGSGGPSLALVERTGCLLTGVDVESAAIAYAAREASARGLSDRARFVTFDCDDRLPFEDEAFDVVLCIDAVLHLRDRFSAIADWARLMRPHGRLVFSDAAVLTGPVSQAEIEIRASQGPLLLAPPGLNDAAIAEAGLILRRVDDRTRSVAEIASRWIAARKRRARELSELEGDAWFDRRQRFLATTAELAADRRLSRFLYVADKPDDHA
jgi:SAM-dependent methyltransferase